MSRVVFKVVSSVRCFRLTGTVPALGKQLYSALHSVQLYNHTVSKNEIEGDQLGEQLYSALHTVVCSCTITLFQTLYKRSEKEKKGHSTLGNLNCNISYETPELVPCNFDFGQSDKVTKCPSIAFGLIS